MLAAIESSALSAWVTANHGRTTVGSTSASRPSAASRRAMWFAARRSASLPAARPSKPTSASISACASDPGEPGLAAALLERLDAERLDRPERTGPFHALVGRALAAPGEQGRGERVRVLAVEPDFGERALPAVVSERYHVRSDACARFGLGATA